MKLKMRNINGKTTKNTSSTLDLYSSFLLSLVLPSSPPNFLCRCLFKQLFFFFQSNQAYPIKAPKTNKIQTIIQAAIAVIPSTLGEFVVIIYDKLEFWYDTHTIVFVYWLSLLGTLFLSYDLTLKMLIRTRNKVMSIAILPGITSGGIRKLTHDTTTNNPDGK